MKDYKVFQIIPYKDIIGYSNVIYGMETIDWKLNPKFKPNERRCFKILAMLSNDETKIYFCVYYSRTDWRRKEKLNRDQGMYVNELWVANINKSLLRFNLETSQEKLLRLEDKIDCNSHVMDPVKIEFRNHVKISFIIVVPSN